MLENFKKRGRVECDRDHELDRLKRLDLEHGMTAEEERRIGLNYLHGRRAKLTEVSLVWVFHLLSGKSGKVKRTGGRTPESKAET